MINNKTQRLILLIIGQAILQIESLIIIKAEPKEQALVLYRIELLRNL